MIRKYTRRTIDELLLKFCHWSGANIGIQCGKKLGTTHTLQPCESVKRISRNSQKCAKHVDFEKNPENAYLLATFGFDTADNEPLKVWGSFEYAVLRTILLIRNLDLSRRLHDSHRGLREGEPLRGGPALRGFDCEGR